MNAARISDRIANPTEGAIMVEASVPGECWEIEFHEDREIGVEILSAKELSRALNSWKIYFADLAIDTLSPLLMQGFAD
jgi:hypothetical protein